MSWNMTDQKGGQLSLTATACIHLEMVADDQAKFTGDDASDSGARRVFVWWRMHQLLDCFVIAGPHLAVSQVP